jgi:hypothetical protein
MMRANVAEAAALHEITNNAAAAINIRVPQKIQGIQNIGLARRIHADKDIDGLQIFDGDIAQAAPIFEA